MWVPAATAAALVAIDSTQANSIAIANAIAVAIAIANVEQAVPATEPATTRDRQSLSLDLEAASEAPNRIVA